MLRGCLTLTLLLLSLTLAVGAEEGADSRDALDENTVPTNGRVQLPTSELTGVDLEDQDAWYTRNFNRFFGKGSPDASGAADSDPQLAQDPFLPYAGHLIRYIVILDRQAFGTVTVDTAATLMENPADSLITRQSTAERALNMLAPQTHQVIIRNFLLFEEGDRLDPFVLSDSERLIRDQAYIKDVRIDVQPVYGEPEVVDIVILVRDRWPWGFKAVVKDEDNYNFTGFHRNLGGLGINLEAEGIVNRGKTPEVGWRGLLSTTNIGGSFINTGFEGRDTWEEQRLRFFAERGFTWPDIRFIGGFGSLARSNRLPSNQPEGTVVKTETGDIWFGRAYNVRDGDRSGRRRTRLIPAVRALHVNFIDAPPPPPDHSGYNDYTRFLGKLSLAGVDYYTTSLVFQYGVTEDIPDGHWLELVGGFETGDVSDRIYHGVRGFIPQFLDSQEFMIFDLGFGGWRNQGHFENGVLDCGYLYFTPLKRRSYGHWRHFFRARYTLGINRNVNQGLRLDEVLLRDLDNDSVRGNQRLVVGVESVLFTPYSLLGFKAVMFGYGSAGMIARQRDPVFQQRIYSNLGIGLRLNNPNTVIPTIEARLGLLNSENGWDPLVSVRMGEIRLPNLRSPGARPDVLPYR